MSRKWLADLGLLFVAFVWGSTFVIVQDAIAIIPPLAFNGWRFLAGALFLLIFFFMSAKKKNVLFNKKLWSHGLLLGAILFVGYGTQTIALLYTTSSKCAFITGLSVVLVPLFSWVILKAVPKKTAIFGAILSAVGLYLLTALGAFSLNRGDMLTLICAIAFGLHIIVTAKVTHSHSSLALTIVQLFTVSMLSFISGAGLNGIKATFSVMPFQHGSVLFACLFTAMFATAIAFLLQTSLQRFTPPTHVGIIFIMEPVFAAITAVVFEQETMNLTAKIGALLILIGMLAAEWPTKRKHKKMTTNPLN